MATDGTTLDGETRALLRLAVSNRRRELAPYVEPRHEPHTLSPRRTRPSERQGRELHTIAEVLCAAAADIYGLTLRESQVLAFFCEGLGNREIGEQLFLSEETVRQYGKSTLAKMRAKNRWHAVALALTSSPDPSRGEAA